mmetsp:Transcript_22682/g.37528  ORF Transcript_22682/g.37528 Transcript_22682/m.37528 type:complete len:123 (-) Transcript_22682:6-374(-)
MTENNNDDKTMQEPLIARHVQPIVMDEQPAVVVTPAPAPASAPADTLLASKRQIQGAAWAGGISGLLVGGPVGALLLAWGSVHLAKKNAGDVGNFCRKSGDFMCRMGSSIRKEWDEARSDNK